MTTQHRATAWAGRHLATALMLIALAAELGAVALVVLMAGRADAIPLAVFMLVTVLVVGYAIVGWLIASRRPDNSIGWIFLTIALSMAGLAFAGAYSLYGLRVAPGSLPFADVLSWGGVWAWAPGFTLLVTLSVLLFPDGRPPSPRWRPVVWASFAVMGLLMVPIAILAWPHRGLDLLEGSSYSGGDLDVAYNLQALGSALIPFLALASIAGMVVRYRHGGQTERQQLRWFTYAAVPEITFLVFVGLAASGSYTIPPLVAFVATLVIGPLLPAAAAVAILRYHLYDLDRLVSRTIAYAVVTGMLVLTYGGLILVLEGPLSDMTGGDTLPVALSTLAVAALFTPARRRVQRTVDHRFDRARYDAERITTAFAERLRDQVDLATVTADFDGTVLRAISPSSVGVWLREGQRR